MTTHETNSMIAHKHFLDAYFSLPLSTRAEIEPVMERAIGLNMAALKQYKTEVRGGITKQVAESKVNQRFTPMLVEDGEIVIL